MSFYKEIKNQIGKIIKILKSGNHKDYFSVAFSSFLSFQRIYISQYVLTLHNKVVY